MYRPLSDIVTELCAIFSRGIAMTSSDLATARPDSYIIHSLENLSEANKKRLQRYVSMLPEDAAEADDVFAFDLTQNPEKRWRVAHRSHMATLTKNCVRWYLRPHRRCLCILAATIESMRIPVLPALQRTCPDVVTTCRTEPYPNHHTCMNRCCRQGEANSCSPMGSQCQTGRSDSCGLGTTSPG